jgi:isocitrate dehydrogenase (NAD+)
MTVVTLIPGDGIGPEICESMQEIFRHGGAKIEWDVQHAGLSAFEKHGQLVPNELVQSIERNRVAIKGPTTTPVGTGHRSVNVYLRQKFELYANVRPVHVIPGIQSLHPGVDLVIVRENTEDLYAGIEYKVGHDVAHGVKLITRRASEQVGRYAFEYARRSKRKKVTIVHKANIMKLTDGLFIEAIRAVHKDFGEIELNDVIVDNCCMQLVTKPQQFDVIVTENLYGDIISDLACGLVGGLGVASGANIGNDIALFEPVHGSAPDIAGKGLANPTALLLSGVEMLSHIGQSDAGTRIRKAILKTLGNSQSRTRDLGGPMGTREFTSAVVSNIA